MQTGIYPNIAEEDYHKSPGLSQSVLKQLREEGGPAKVKFRERPTTRPQKFGRLVHTTLLQPHLLSKHYAVTDLLTVGTKAWLEAEQAAMGRELVKRPEYDRAQAIRDGVMRWSSVAREMLDPAHIRVEQSFYWPDPDTGFLCRGRADVANDDYQVLMDLKSTVDASTDSFRRAVRDYGYHIQAAHYLDGWHRAGGWKPVEFIILAAEKEAPYLCASYVLDAADIAEGRAELRKLLAIWRHCEETGDWPGYDPGLQSLSLNR